MARGGFFGDAEEFLEDGVEVLRLSESPVASDGEVNAEWIGFVFVGADFIGCGSALEINVGLEGTAVVKGDAHVGLAVDHTCAVGAEGGEEWVIAEEDIGEEFVVVSAVFEIEAEGDFHAFVVEVAEAEVVRGLEEDEFAECADESDVVGAGAAESQGVAIEADISSGLAGLRLFVEHHTCFFAAAETYHAGECSADSFEEVQYSFARGLQFELHIQTRRNGELIAKRGKRPHGVAPAGFELPGAYERC